MTKISQEQKSFALSIPDAFYFLESNSQESFRHTPSGRPPKVERLIQGQKAWPELGLGRTRRQKKILLNDWTAFSWSYQKTDAVIACIRGLWEEGFEIIIWQSGILQPLTEDTLHCLKGEYVREKMSAEYNNVLSDAAFSQYRIPKDQLQILDDWGVEALIQGNEALPRRIRMDDFGRQSGDPEKLLQILDAASPTLTEIHDVLLKIDSHAFDSLLTHFPEAKVITALAEISLTQGQLLDLFDQGQYTHIKGDNIQIPMDLPQLMESITYLRYSMPYKDLPRQKEYLKTLISGAKQLRRLKFFSVDFFDDDLLSKILEHDVLEELDIYGGPINERQLLTLAEKFWDLRALYLVSCGRLFQTEATFEAILKLKNLQNIALSISGTLQKALLTCLEGLPELRKIALSASSNMPACETMADDVFFALHRLKHLESIVLKFYYADLSGLQEILEGAWRVKSIRVETAQFSGTLALPAGVFRALEILDIKLLDSRKILEAGILESLLQAAPQLQVLKVHANLSEFLDFQEKSYSQLVEIQLKSFLPGNGIAIAALLMATPNLVMLHLSSTECNKDKKTPFPLPPASLMALRELDIAGVSLPVLQSLLLAAPQLKKIRLYKCDIPEQSRLDFDALQNLETLMIRSSLKTASLQMLLETAPRLTSLMLHGTDGRLSLDPFSLPMLERVHFAGFLRPDLQQMEYFLENLLKAAPHLKYLTVDYEGSEIRLDPKNMNDLIYLVDISKKCSGTKEKAYVFDPNAFNFLSELPFLRNKKHYIDADTQAKTAEDAEDTVQRIFYHPSGFHPDITLYRKELYNTLTPNPEACPAEMAFCLEKKGGLDLTARPPLFTNENLWGYVKSQQKKNTGFFARLVEAILPSVIYGKQSFQLTKDWQPITSLSPREIMTHCHPSVDVGIEIQYSQRDNQYYIRSTEGPVVLDLEFVIEVPYAEKREISDTSIRAQADRINQFGIGKLVTQKETMRGDEWLDALLEQAVGACRHRAAVFKGWMNRHFPEVPVRIVNNEVHSFIEIQLEGRWITRNLGGYPSSLHILEQKLDTIGTEACPQIEWNLPGPSPLVTQYQKMFKKDGDAQSFFSYEGYCQELIAGKVEKRLIELDSAMGIEALKWALRVQSYRPIFFVHSPDDLICSAPFIQAGPDGTGEIKAGPGGALHDFLTRHRDGAPLIVVDYSTFKADDIVRFNAMLDDTRRVDGTPLPLAATIIGLTNSNNPAQYKESDITSRYDLVEKCPFTTEALMSALPPHPLQPEEKSAELPFIINLFNASDWKEKLLGHWSLDGDKLVFRMGALEKALASGAQCISIWNGPFDDLAFERFWWEAIQYGQIHHADRKIIIPNNIILTRRKGYPDCNEKIEMREVPIVREFVLNKGLLGGFLEKWDCRNNQLYPLPGHIENACGKTLPVFLTRDLSEEQWALLNDVCRKSNVQLSVRPAPSAIQKPFEGEPLLTQVIATSDPDTTVASLVTASNEHPLVIDVSEYEADQLFTHIHPHFDAASLRFSFEPQEKVLLKALNAGRHVILTGQFSESLQDAVAACLYERPTQSPSPGILSLVHPIGAKVAFGFPTVALHAVTPAEKLAHLGVLPDRIINALSPFLKTESLSTLKARVHFLLSHPETDVSEGAWAGMKDLAILLPASECDFEKSAEISAACMQKRRDAMLAVLEYSPYVFLTGLTGTGKTTFVEKEFHDGTLYFNESSTSAWAKDHSPGRKYLFIDEANLSPRQWSEFEGLFQKPPGIVIEGTFYPLTAEHKVIFAGNPVRYGDERHLAPFFARHGGAVTFDPLPPETLYEKTLKPVFEGTVLEEKASDIATPILAAYKTLCAFAKNEVPITPRELQMMALLILCHHRNHPDIPLSTLTQQVVFDIAHPLVPEEGRAIFEKKFRPAILPPLLEEKMENFCVTPSRVPVIRQLVSLLDLREMRPAGKNSAQRCGGIQGCVLEGLPGIGKSELVVELLRARGYEEVHPDDREMPKKPFYCIPASLALEEKIKRLLEAFDLGAVVIMDEINCSPLLERLINQLLSGTRPPDPPSTKDRPAHQPGFTLIATQNPASMAGRRLPSNALARRLLTLSLPEYTDKEVRDILIARGLPAPKADALAEAFALERRESVKRHINPPTFRDVLRVAKNLLRGQKAESPQRKKNSRHSEKKRVHFFNNHPPKQATRKPHPFVKKMVH